MDVNSGSENQAIDVTVSQLKQKKEYLDVITTTTEQKMKLGLCITEL